MRVYLAGPMRGYAEFNFPAFLKAASDLRSQFGWEVISPAEHDLEVGIDPSNPDLPEGFVNNALRWDLNQIMDDDTDAIALLPHWHDSTGAQLEVACAKAFGRKIIGLYQDSEGYYQIITPHQPQENRSRW